VKTAALVGLVVALLLVTALVSPLVASGLAAAGWSFRFTRVYNRVFEVLLVVAIALGWRHLDLGGPAGWGFRRPQWRRDLAVGLAIGLAGVGVALAAAWAGGGVLPALRFPPLKTVRKVGAGLVVTGIIATTEETLFRGILLRRFTSDLGGRGGLLLTTAVYAIVHALRAGPKITATGWAAGWERTATLFAPLGDPTVWPSVAGLFVLGLSLAVLRGRTGALWASIGVHAAWVGVFRVGRLFVDIRPRPVWLVGPGWPPLVGGVAGILGVLVTCAGALAWRASRGSSAKVDPPQRFRP